TVHAYEPCTRSIRDSAAGSLQDCTDVVANRPDYGLFQTRNGTYAHVCFVILACASRLRRHQEPLTPHGLFPVRSDWCSVVSSDQLSAFCVMFSRIRSGD